MRPNRRRYMKMEDALNESLHGREGDLRRRDSTGPWREMGVNARVGPWEVRGPSLCHVVPSRSLTDSPLRQSDERRKEATDEKRREAQGRLGRSQVQHSHNTQHSVQVKAPTGSQLLGFWGCTLGPTAQHFSARKTGSNRRRHTQRPHSRARATSSTLRLANRGTCRH